MPLRIDIRAAHADDRERWAELFREYRAFYRFAPDEAVVERVWGWLQDNNDPVRGLVAEVDGVVVGLAHVRRFPRPSSGTVGVFLDDLFTDPAVRGNGVASALIGAVADVTRRDGLSVVRWNTAFDNAPARSLYDRLTGGARWVSYDLVVD